MTDEFSILDYLGNVAPVVLVMGVVLYVLWKEYKALKEEIKQKSEAHGLAMQAKDDKIQELNDHVRKDSLDNMSVFKDIEATLSDLVKELKVRNDG